MADDQNALLLEIGVTQARMERELARVVKQGVASAAQIEKSFGAANQNIAAGAGKLGPAFQKGTKQAADGVKNTSGAVSNLTSQLNDIGVQLAGGQSPFLIMLQQGTQISQLFTQTGTTIRGFGGILASAAMSALNPFSLLTFAIIGLGGTAVQYFAELVSGSDNSTQALKEQEQVIRSVAQRWGEAIPVLQEYVDALDRAKQIAELQTTSDVIKAGAFTEISNELDAFTEKYAGLINIFDEVASNAMNSENVLYDVGTAWAELSQKIQDGTATQEDFARVQAAATQAAATTGSAEILAFADAIAALGGTLDAPIAKLGQLLTLAGRAAMLDPKTWRGAGVQSVKDGNIQNPGFTTPEEGPVPSSRPLIELEGLPGAGRTGGGGGRSKRKAGGSAGSNSYASEVESIKERTESLRQSTAAQAAINPLINDYGYALEKARAEQRLLSDAERQKLNITPQLREEISNLATAYAQATVDAKKLDEEQKTIRDNAKKWADLEKDVFGGFLKDLKDGVSLSEALGNALQRLSDRLLDMGLDALFNSKSGAGGGGSIFGSLLGGIGKIFGFASGTSNTGGRPGQPRGVVHGQEAVIPMADGDIPVKISQPDVKETRRTASRDVVDIRLADDSGRMAEVADQRIQTASGTIIRVATESSYKTVKNNMFNLMSDAQARNS